MAKKTIAKKAATKKTVAKKINFTLKVTANDIDPEKDAFDCKVVLDFSPPFSARNNSDWQGFHANKVRRLLNFISDRVIKKVVEAIYYDRGVATYDSAKSTYAPTNGHTLPPKYKEAMDIYDERRAKKKKNGTSHLDIKERKSKNVKDDNENCIECIVNTLLKDTRRPIWGNEANVTRVTFQQQSPPSLTLETRTAVNGDKKPK